MEITSGKKKVEGSLQLKTNCLGFQVSKCWKDHHDVDLIADTASGTTWPTGADDVHDTPALLDAPARVGCRPPTHCECPGERTCRANVLPTVRAHGMC